MERNLANIKERILYYTDNKGIAKEKFFENLGTTYGNFKGKAKDQALGSDVIERIITNYSEINPEWLLTGKGEMLNHSVDMMTAYSFEVNKRIELLVKHFANGDMSKFYKLIGVSPRSINEKSIVEAITNALPNIRAEWLLLGIGDMIRSEVTIVAESNAYYGKKEGIPLIPLNAMAGIANGEISILEMDCERYIVPMFKGADYLIPVKGSSMYPKYSSGDVVACKIVPLKDIFFQWNKVYVLDTNQGPIIKRLGKSEKENHIKIISENPKYEPFDLKIQHIYAVAIVIGVVRLE